MKYILFLLTFIPLLFSTATFAAGEEDIAEEATSVLTTTDASTVENASVPHEIDASTREAISILDTTNIVLTEEATNISSNTNASPFEQSQPRTTSLLLSNKARNEDVVEIESPEPPTYPHLEQTDFEALICQLDRLQATELQNLILDPLIQTLEDKLDTSTAPTESLATVTLQSPIYGVSSVCLSPDMHTLAFGTWGSSGWGTITLWNVHTGDETASLRVPWGVDAVCFSPDGNTLASASPGMATITLWDIPTLTQINTLRNPYPCFLCFSPDGHTLASGSWDGTITLWNLRTCTKITTFQGHTGQIKGDIKSLCFSPDGRTLACGLWDKKAEVRGNEIITLWDIPTRTQIAILQGHEKGHVNPGYVWKSPAVSSVCFSPDGHTLASGSWDSTITLWNLRTRTQVTTLHGHTSPVMSVCFSPDGHTLTSVSRKEIKLWDTDLWDTDTLREAVNHLTPSQKALVYTAFKTTPKELILSKVDKEFREKYGENLPLLLNLKHSFETLDERIKRYLQNHLHVKMEREKHPWNSNLLLKHRCELIDDFTLAREEQSSNCTPSSLAIQVDNKLKKKKRKLGCVIS